MAANILSLFTKPSNRLIIYASEVSTICGANRFNEIRNIVDKNLSTLGIVTKISEKQQFQIKIDNSKKGINISKRNYSTDLEKEQNPEKKSKIENDLKKLKEKEILLTNLEKTWNYAPKHTSDLDKFKKNLEETSINLESDPEALEAIKLIKSNANKNYGIKHESDALTEYEKMYGNKVSRLNKTIFRELTNKGKNTGMWFGGRLDGFVEIDGNISRIVEVKCRTSQLFNNVPIYEFYQIQTYLFITNSAQCDLIEYTKSDNNDSNSTQMNVLSVNKDHQFWTEKILPKIKLFYKLMHKIITTPNEYTTLNEQSKNNYINKFMN